MVLNIKRYRLLLALSFLTFALPGFAWNALGHMLVAQIAYDTLPPSSAARAQMDILTDIIASTYWKSNTFPSAGPWADDLRNHGVNVFNTWHYIDINFSQDNTPFPSTPPEVNVAWAIEESVNILKSKYSLKVEKASALQMLSHLVADIHQPLHAASRYSKDNPSGDAGGNGFALHYKDPAGRYYYNLHSLWDSAVGSMPLSVKRPLKKGREEKVQAHAKKWMAAFPDLPTDRRLDIVDPFKWSAESHEIARKRAYHGIEPDTTPANEYIATNTYYAQEQIVLAGYRLANLLKEIYPD